MNEQEILKARWAPSMNHIVAGWAVMANGVVVASVLSERLARHIVSVHNYHSRQEGVLPEEERDG